MEHWLLISIYFVIVLRNNFLLPVWNIKIIVIVVVIGEEHPQCRNVVWNTKASANILAFLFQTTVVHLGGYSTLPLFLDFLKKIDKYMYYWNDLTLGFVGSRQLKTEVKVSLSVIFSYLYWNQPANLSLHKTSLW